MQAREAFRLISKEEVNDFLELKTNWEEYKGDFESRDEDNRLLQKNIKKLLPFLSIEKIQDFMESIYLKALGQTLGLAGLASKAIQLPQTSVNLLDPETGHAKRILIPDFDHKDMIDFANWHPLEYLLYHLYFLIECYFNVSKECIKRETLPLDREILLKALEHEIWITVNAYQIRQSYGECLKDKEKLGQLIQDYLTAILTTPNEAEFEFTLPCGSASHAVYISLIYFKLDEKLVLRIDNSSLEQSSGVAISLEEKKNLEEVKRYLIEVCNQIKEKNNEQAMGVIYNRYEDYTFQLSGEDYPKQEEQKAPNCVVEGFRRGMGFRLWQIGESKKDEVFQWLFKRSLEFAAVLHTTPKKTIFEQQCHLRNKTYLNSQKRSKASTGSPDVGNDYFSDSIIGSTIENNTIEKNEGDIQVDVDVISHQTNNKNNKNIRIQGSSIKNNLFSGNKGNITLSARVETGTKNKINRKG